jgi:hypothetical protein
MSESGLTSNGHGPLFERGDLRSVQIRPPAFCSNDEYISLVPAYLSWKLYLTISPYVTGAPVAPAVVDFQAAVASPWRTELEEELRIRLGTGMKMLFAAQKARSDMAVVLEEAGLMDDPDGWRRSPLLRLGGCEILITEVLRCQLVRRFFNKVQGYVLHGRELTGDTYSHVHPHTVLVAPHIGFALDLTPDTLYPCSGFLKHSGAVTFTRELPSFSSRLIVLSEMPLGRDYVKAVKDYPL